MTRDWLNTAVLDEYLKILAVFVIVVRLPSLAPSAAAPSCHAQANMTGPQVLIASKACYAAFAGQLGSTKQSQLY